MEAYVPSNNRKIWLINTILLSGAMVILTACSPTSTGFSPAPINEPICPECETLECPEPVRYEDIWATSPHADKDAEPFNHWNAENPQEIPIECAKCHSRPGFIDFLGVDGTVAGQVDHPASIGTTITCFVCHNEATDDFNSVVFPSGVKIRDLGSEAQCIQCHEGIASTTSVDNAIAVLGLTEPDVTSTNLEFINSHFSSGATPFGADTQGAYQYAGKVYSGSYKRGEEFFACTRCHDQHSLELKFDTCGECHTITGTEAKDIRVDTTDFDGDGNTSEGIAYEVAKIHEALYATIQAYALQIVGIPIVYDVGSHPFFFIDTNGNGELDAEENRPDNGYNTWTPRLLRAAYNYNYFSRDPGAYAHNIDYTIQILYDSLSDLGGDVTSMTRP